LRKSKAIKKQNYFLSRRNSKNWSKEGWSISGREKSNPGSKSGMSYDVQISIYEQPYYRWRELYERMKINQAK